MITEKLQKFTDLLKKGKSEVKESGDESEKSYSVEQSSDSAAIDSPLSNSLVKEKRSLRLVTKTIDSPDRQTKKTTIVGHPEIDKDI